MLATYVFCFLGQQLNLLYENLKKWYKKFKETQSILENAFPTYPYFGYFSVFHDMSQDGHTSTLKVLSCVQGLFDETSESSYLQHI